MPALATLSAGASLIPSPQKPHCVFSFRKFLLNPNFARGSAAQIPNNFLPLAFAQVGLNAKIVLVKLVGSDMTPTSWPPPATSALSPVSIFISHQTSGCFNCFVSCGLDWINKRNSITKLKSLSSLIYYQPVLLLNFLRNCSTSPKTPWADPQFKLAYFGSRDFK